MGNFVLYRKHFGGDKRMKRGPSSTDTCRTNTLLFIMDGLGGRPPKTGLMMSNHPNLDRIAESGTCGLMVVHGRGIKPESEDAHLRIFGYNPKVYLKGRGPLEALGLGVRLRENDIAFRANLATVKDVGGGTVELVDRRAGRIPTITAKRLTEKIRSVRIDGVRFLYYQGVEHRGVVVIRPDRGVELSPKVYGNDPVHSGRLRARPVNRSRAAKRTAELINEYVAEVHKILNSASINKNRVKRGLLPANYILLRGAGEYTKIPSMKERFGMRCACVAGAPLYKGVARYVGMKTFEVRGATGDKKTNIRNKVRTAVRLLNEKDGRGRWRYDLVFLHIKATDSFAHDKDCEGKARFIEKIDRYLATIMKEARTHNIIITGDHATPCIVGDHTDDPVPIMISGPMVEPDEVERFDEEECKKGRLGTVFGRDIIRLIKRMNSGTIKINDQKG